MTLLVLGLTGCGGDKNAQASTQAPDSATADCRAQWKKVGEDIAGKVSLTQPSALPQRWNSVAATVDYYRTSATSKDCGARIEAQQKAITALTAFSARLTAYDMESRLARVKDDATAYAAGPWPAAPKASPAPKPKKGQKARKPKQPPRPPKPALVGAALKTLTTQAPRATDQQRPGWDQADVTDLGDTAAVAKAVKDLRFLSGESSAWRACAAALATIDTALAAKK